MENKFPNWDYHTSSIIEGRILIMWRRLSVKIIITEESSQAIHCQVKMLVLQQDFGVSFVYGLNSIEGRRCLWDGLQRPYHMLKAWIYLGDFNAPLSGKDRVGGKAVSDSELHDSTNWLAGAQVEPLRDRIGDLQANYQKAKESYLNAQLQAQAHPLDSDYQITEMSAAGEYAIQEKLYQSFLTQRSKVTWLWQGDLNTAFFHAFLKKRKAENGIVSFITEEGQVVDNYTEVVSHFLGHFKTCLGSPSSASGRVNMQHVDLGPKLSVDQQMLLLKPFSKKEIKEALFSIPNTKSPGPDGYGSGFFKAVWSKIGEEVCSAISFCFESGRFPSKLHDTTISLIPKIANPSRTVDYRPIACCSTLYKCMDKLICKRLAAVLPVIVHPNQGAFIQGRSIAHNIMICQDLIKNYGRVSTSSRCAIKKDLSKSYDTVDWLFLEGLLEALKFPIKFIGWGTLPVVRSVKMVLDEFAIASGLIINTGESQIFFGGVSLEDRKRISQDINLALGSFPLSYLGVPMRPTKWKHTDFKEVERLCRGFLWGVSGQRSKLHLPSWQKVCLPKAYGGVGFREGSLWNWSVLAKYVWALSFKHDLLWVKWINSIYLKDKSFWSYELKGDCSWYWRKLCHLKKYLSFAAIVAAGMKGKFLSSKLYNSLLTQQKDEYFWTVWSRIILPKHKFMLWQVIHSQLLTRDNLNRFHIPLISLLCPAMQRGLWISRAGWFGSPELGAVPRLV
ncbi:uncharacterized protein LOC133815291 [Humulus lupulus]|uniref:uncharacterized protein LOC133815291 n=1 Tax=Humulus lupulus TaxID=3486 RepID=UPI002B40D790|nr:uncharacterized protein LOC133815291 [Humulus lupulus]